MASFSSSAPLAPTFKERHCTAISGSDDGIAAHRSRWMRTGYPAGIRSRSGRQTITDISNGYVQPPASRETIRSTAFFVKAMPSSSRRTACPFVFVAMVAFRWSSVMIPDVDLTGLSTPHELPRFCICGCFVDNRKTRTSQCQTSAF